jgi:hypothetical protein
MHKNAPQQRLAEMIGVTTITICSRTSAQYLDSGAEPDGARPSELPHRA